MAKKKAKAKAKKATKTTTKKAEPGGKRGKRPSSFCIMADMGPEIGIRVVEVGIKDSTSGWNRIKSPDFIAKHPEIKNCPLRVFASGQRDSMFWECSDVVANESDLQSLEETLKNTTNSMVRERIEEMIRELKTSNAICTEVVTGFCVSLTRDEDTELEVSNTVPSTEPDNETPEQVPEEDNTIIAHDTGGDGEPSEVNSVPNLTAVPPELPPDLPQPPPPPPFVNPGDEGI